MDSSLCLCGCVCFFNYPLSRYPNTANKRTWCSIVYQNEFSSRLSAASIMRLRASAIMALSQDGSTDSTMVLKLARQFLFVSDHLRTKDEKKLQASNTADTNKVPNLHINGNHHRNDSMRPFF